jgi:uncharacterized Zn-binding protein involved in type VI secretion
MPALVRLNDPSNHGGKMITATGNFTVNNKGGCVQGDMHQCPINGHGTTPVTATTSKATSNGKGLLRVGDKAGCGATITTGSPDTDSD